MGFRSRTLGALQRLLHTPGRASPRKAPPPFVPNPTASGLETSAGELLSRLARGEALVFVDVRDENERDLFIPGALHLSLGELPLRWAEITDIGGIPVCFCATGGQSINAAASLRERGLTEATSILNGLPAWEDAGGAVAHAPSGSAS